MNAWAMPPATFEFTNTPSVPSEMVVSLMLIVLVTPVEVVNTNAPSVWCMREFVTFTVGPFHDATDQPFTFRNVLSATCTTAEVLIATRPSKFRSAKRELSTETVPALVILSPSMPWLSALSVNVRLRRPTVAPAALTTMAGAPPEATMLAVCPGHAWMVTDLVTFTVVVLKFAESRIQIWPPVATAFRAAGNKRHGNDT